MTTVSLRAAMDELPTASAGQVATFLLGRGVVGVRRDVDRCPLAVYLTARTGRSVAVGNVIAFYDDSLEDAHVLLPRVIEHFVRLFDDVAFPELIDHETATTTKEGPRA